MKRRDFAALAAVAAALPACGDGIDVAEWTEEVLLHDGRMVTVWRRARAYSSGFPNANRGANIDFELRYEPMGVVWKDTFNRNPVSFEIIDGIAYLATYINDRETCGRMPPTAYTAQFLRWTGSAWVELPQAEFPTDKAFMNLSEHFWGHTSADDYKGRIAWSDKRLMGNRNPMDTIKSYFERGQRFCSNYRKI